MLGFQVLGFSGLALAPLQLLTQGGAQLLGVLGFSELALVPLQLLTQGRAQLLGTWTSRSNICAVRLWQRVAIHLFGERAVICATRPLVRRKDVGGPCRPR